MLFCIFGLNWLGLSYWLFCLINPFGELVFKELPRLLLLLFVLLLTNPIYLLFAPFYLINTGFLYVALVFALFWAIFVAFNGIGYLSILPDPIGRLGPKLVFVVKDWCLFLVS